MSGYEWLLDFSYNQTTTILPELFSNNPIHQGFGTALNIMWNAPMGGVAATLQDLVVTQKVVTSITVSGHSLGAGVSTLMSYAIQAYLGNKGLGNIVVDGILFAPPNVGPPQLAQDFNKKVNGRYVSPIVATGGRVGGAAHARQLIGKQPKAAVHKERLLIPPGIIIVIHFFVTPFLYCTSGVSLGKLTLSPKYLAIPLCLPAKTAS